MKEKKSNSKKKELQQLCRKQSDFDVYTDNMIQTIIVNESENSENSESGQQIAIWLVAITIAILQCHHYRANGLSNLTVYLYFSLWWTSTVFLLTKFNKVLKMFQFTKHKI